MSPVVAGSTSLPSARPADADRATVVAALVIAGAALALRVALSPQFDGIDDLGYFQAAHRVSSGRTLDGMFPLFQTRIGMAYPLGWLLKAGWLQPSQFWVLTSLAECITLASLFACARLLTGTARAGLAAVALYAIYPLAVQQALVFYPTAFQVASIAAAAALIAAAETRPRRPARLALALAAGLSLGLGYLVKEDVAIVVPAIALASLITGFPRRSTALVVCGGAAAIFAAECAGYWLSTGQPLFRLTATSGLGAAMEDQLHIKAIWRWDAFLRSLFLMPAQVGLIWWCAIPAVWSAFRRGDARLKFAATTFVILALYLQFGSGSPTSYSPLPKTPRYTALVTPFLVLLVGVWFARLFERGRRVPALALAVVVAIAAVPCLAFSVLASGERTRNTLALLPVIRAMAPGHLYTDYYGAQALRILAPELPDVRVWYHARFDTNQIVVSANPGIDDEAYVLLDRQVAKIYTSSYEMTLPPEIDHPPAAWRIVWSGRAYAEGTLARALLEGIRAAAQRLPNGNPLSSRINRNISDMIDGDHAMLYRVPAAGFTASRVAPVTVRP